MKQKKVIFRDDEIVEFCRATLDTNDIHDPIFMAKLGKRVIVPGMFALSQTANLSAAFLKNRAASLKVLFNSLLSSGDFVTLVATSLDENPNEIRLSAINCKDTLTSKDEYTRLSIKKTEFRTDHGGRLLRLDVTPEQLEKFIQLIGKEDIDVTHFLFAIAYASQALFRCINHPENDIEKEIDDTISKNPSISPFYHSLEIRIPSPFPIFDPVGALDYHIFFEREKPLKIYNAFVRCEHQGNTIFQAHYKLVGIADRIILRMAKEMKHHYKV
jgi:acyl dehydratase